MNWVLEVCASRYLASCELAKVHERTAPFLGLAPGIGRNPLHNIKGKAGATDRTFSYSVRT